uniref:Putative secreted protein n=1 Tax=Ixodes ricinus TaxID=34613 RepID=A0A6B0UPB2_IXORI
MRLIWVSFWHTRLAIFRTFWSRSEGDLCCSFLPLGCLSCAGCGGVGLGVDDRPFREPSRESAPPSPVSAGRPESRPPSSSTSLDSSTPLDSPAAPEGSGTPAVVPLAPSPATPCSPLESERQE